MGILSCCFVLGFAINRRGTRDNLAIFTDNPMLVALLRRSAGCGVPILKHRIALWSVNIFGIGTFCRYEIVKNP